MVIFGISTKNFVSPANIVFSKNIFAKQTKVYGVSKTASEFQGQKIYASVKDLPEVPEIAVFAMSSAVLMEVLEECITLGIKGAVCITSGFGEVGEEGERLQNLLRERCISAQFPLIGPNCVGVYCPPWIDTIFVPTERFYVPRKGNVAVISQSGGMILDQFFQNFAEFGRNIGVSAVVSIGNKAVIDEVDLLEYFMNDSQTDVICFYLEGFSPGAGRRFCELASKCSKDLVLYPGGQTESSGAAIKSHTATLAVNSRVASAAYAQYSIVVSKTESQMISAVKVFSELHQMYDFKCLDDFDGTGIVVLTESGGHGVVCADLLDTYNLKLLEFTKEEQEEMRNVVSPLVKRIGSMNNPIDLTGSGLDDDVVAILRYLIKNKRVKCIINLIFPYLTSVTIMEGTKIVEAVENLHPTKPIVHFIPRHPKWDIIRGSIETIHLPCALTIEEAVYMVVALRDKCLGQKRKENRSGN